jgi:hypothetical protein
MNINFLLQDYSSFCIGDAFLYKDCEDPENAKDGLSIPRLYCTRALPGTRKLRSAKRPASQEKLNTKEQLPRDANRSEPLLPWMACMQKMQDAYKDAGVRAKQDARAEQFSVNESGSHAGTLKLQRPESTHV